ncbi:uncharacterized protein LAESUDRAFT_732366 [Laetiporus sulphureus 93-53]|uniref:Nidogen G2 beta-barrel domain-containing protein n=1 Tax=Laetiporus sulphureus 93-53 TaxID=1314785 RepID=A0A165B6G3_9APHY|nr:uncharacterized protein LAESUDRAFT_732366 [Laetiporus sulphureus 93-53]KZT00350.1 hypothetical protein LAESUDRAFT_732366 [Laetiporus sulphureus 93-53]
MATFSTILKVHSPVNPASRGTKLRMTGFLRGVLNVYTFLHSDPLLSWYNLHSKLESKSERAISAIRNRGLPE